MFNIPSLSNPILLTVFYRVVDDSHAELSIKGSNEADSTFNIVYGSFDGIKTISFPGDKESPTLFARNNETITLHACRESIVVGTAQYLVDVALAGTHGLILAPVSLVNVSERQEDLSVIASCQSVTKLYEGSQVL